MNKILIVCSLVILLLFSCNREDAGKNWLPNPPKGKELTKVLIDTMDMPNPFVVYDKKNDIYYMTGDGGYMWRSDNLRIWEGPFDVLLPAADSWIGENALITSPEIHRYNGRYYYMATFTRPDVVIEEVAGRIIHRRSCELFVSDSIFGPYKRVAKDAPLLTAAEQSAEHPTFCVDEINVGYMIYNHCYEQNNNGTIQIIRLGDYNLDVQVGEPYKMFKASQNSWSRNEEDNGFSPVMNAPFMFDTYGGELGILFTTYIGDSSAVGVAYTEKGHGLNGPWHIDPQPLLTGGVGGAMLFDDYDGTLVMVLHKDTIVNGQKRKVPRLMEMDPQFDKLKLKGHYKF